MACALSNGTAGLAEIKQTPNDSVKIDESTARTWCTDCSVQARDF